MSYFELYEKLKDLRKQIPIGSKWENSWYTYTVREIYQGGGSGRESPEELRLAIDTYGPNGRYFAEYEFITKQLGDKGIFYVPALRFLDEDFVRRIQ